jgi:hypothetical protein
MKEGSGSREVRKSERKFMRFEAIFLSYGLRDFQSFLLPGRDGQIIRKVKAVSPSPFYDGKYHPPLLRQQMLLIY